MAALASLNEVSKEILRYYLTYPDACETAEGLARWRLIQVHVERTVRETNEAVVDLVRRGLLTKTTRRGVEVLFMMNRERAAEARTLVEDPPAGKTDGDR
ncbi:MAG: hypothetical protein ABI665_12095 [Vicinamibacterales bacterium]